MEKGIEELRKRYPWPEQEPDVAADPRGWYASENRALIASILSPQTKVVLELGAFLGMSTRHLCQCAPNATIITIDHWRGSEEHFRRPELAAMLPVMYETFLKNLWPWRERVIPVRSLTTTGTAEIAALDIVPEMVYIDAAHDADSVSRDLNNVLSSWPEAHIVGDDWMWVSVRDGVGRVLPKVPPQRRFQSHRACWEIAP